MMRIITETGPLKNLIHTCLAYKRYNLYILTSIKKRESTTRRVLRGHFIRDNCTNCLSIKFQDRARTNKSQETNSKLFLVWQVIHHVTRRLIVGNGCGIDHRSTSAIHGKNQTVNSGHLDTSPLLDDSLAKLGSSGRSGSQTIQTYSQFVPNMFRSGLRPGQGITLMLFCRRNCWVALAVCALALSCWKMKFGWRAKKGTRWGLNTWSM